MKRWLWFILLIVGFMAVFYFLIPVSASVSCQVLLHGNARTVYRSFTSARLLEKWWVSKSQARTEKKEIIVSEGACHFTIAPDPFNVVSIRMECRKKPVQTYLTMLPLMQDSTAVIWKANVQNERGLFARIQNYFEARAVKKDMQRVLEQLQQFLQSSKGIYDLPINQENVTGTLLVVTRLRDTVLPNPATYYGLLHSLRQYIAAQGAQEINYPMLNVSETDTSQYEIMVAIPINKKVPDKGAILFKRMLADKLLVAEVMGGPAMIEDGFAEMELYMNEHNLKAAGRSFQLLITDRLAEKDTAKWRTKLYYPLL